jgi:F plasmid transfer operon, TraF, protein
MQTHRQLIFMTLLMMSSKILYALPFNSYDPRIMGMGGAGVAVGDASTAPLLNPALLSVTRYSDNFSLVLPTLGVRVSDPEKLIENVDDFQSGMYVLNLQTAVTTLNTAIAVPDFAAISTSAADVSTRLTTLSTQLSNLNSKPVTLEGGGATIIGIPNKKFGIAFFANATVNTGGLFLYKDAATLEALAVQAACLSAAAAAADSAAVTACGAPNFTIDTPQSAVTLRGVLTKEYGIAFSREFRIKGNNVAFGFTPKVVELQLYEIPLGINSPGLSNFTSRNYKAKYDLVNFDVGIANNFRNNWRSGLVIKNIPIPTGERLKLRPQTRAGISYSNKWSTLAADIDLYSNDPAGLERRTQYLALGGELNTWNFAQIRVGYRFDLINNSRDIASVGLGFSPFGIHADVAVAGNANEVAASFQMGFRF